MSSLKYPMGKSLNDMEDGKPWAFVGILLWLLGFFIVFFMRRNNRYAMYYAKQGAILSIVYVIFALLRGIPFIGWIIYLVGSIFVVFLWVMGLIYSLSGEEKEIPIIGEFAKRWRT